MIRSTSLEPRMFRAWMKNETCFTLTWFKSFGLGARLYVTVEDDDSCWWAINIDLFFLEFYIPLFLRYFDDPKDAMEGPSWGAMLSREFGLFLYWGHKYAIFEWPFQRFILERAYLSGTTFINTLEPGHENEDQPPPDVKTEIQILTVQNGKWRYLDAKYVVWRCVWTRKGLHRLWWPKRVTGYADVTYYEKDGTPVRGGESIHVPVWDISDGGVVYAIRDHAQHQLG